MKEAFEMFWPKLEEKLIAAQTKTKPVAAKPARSGDEVVEEILELSRATSRSVSQLVSLEERLLTSVEMMAFASPRRSPADEALRAASLYGLGGAIVGKPIQIDRNALRDLYDMPSRRNVAQVLAEMASKPEPDSDSSQAPAPPDDPKSRKK